MKFIINNNEYSLKSLYQTITIKQGIDIVNIELTEEDFKDLMITDDIEFPQHIINYMIKVLAVLTDCPEEVLKQTDPIHIAVLFNEVKYIISSLHYFNFENYKPIGVKEFTFKNNKYYFPESLHINNEEIFMYKEPSKNVIEVSNLMQVISEMKDKGIELLPVLCAIYLREEGDEVYNEEKIAKRAEIFKELPLSIAYEVFFCTYFSLINYLINSKTYLSQKPKIKERLKNLILGFYRWLNKVLQVLKKKLKN